MRASPQPYSPPDFAAPIAKHAPSHRLKLGMHFTPIHQWNLHAAVDIPEHIQIHLKRDDMTGATTSGNKIRKLEFILADAVKEGCDTVITAGGVQSNHARATAVAAKELGLDAHVFLRTRESDKPEELGSDGNVLIHKMLGVQMHLVRPVSYLVGLLPKMEQLKESLAEKGKKAYLIGIGGSNKIGLWGYIQAFAEMVEQGVCDDFTDIVVPVGSGGTASGLAIGNYLAGSRVRMHAVTVCDTPAYFYGHLDEMLEAVGLSEKTTARQILNIMEAKGRGYARNTDEELEMGMRISRETGIMLDRVYTLKAVYGLVKELNNPAGIFERNARILFVHTGGIFGLFDRRVEPFLDNTLAKTWSQSPQNE